MVCPLTLGMQCAPGVLCPERQGLGWSWKPGPLCGQVAARPHPLHVLLLLMVLKLIIQLLLQKPQVLLHPLDLFREVVIFFLQVPLEIKQHLKHRSTMCQTPCTP